MPLSNMNFYTLSHWLVEAILIALCVGPVFKWFSVKVGLTDRPDSRKIHEGPIPLIGGLMIGTSYASTTFINDLTHPGLLGSVVALLILGAIDDALHVRARTRFLFHAIIVGFLIISNDLSLHDLGELMPGHSLTLGFLAFPFTMLCFMGLINAMNMIDGADGLAGGIALIAMGWFVAASFLNGGIQLGAMLVFAAGLWVFLLFNARYPGHPRATLYMGDAGSTTIGLLLGYFGIALCTSNTAALSPIAVVWILALPVMDTLRVMFSRLWRKKNPFIADRVHIHHVLIDSGCFTHGQATWMLWILSAVFGAIGFFGYRSGVRDGYLFMGIVLLAPLMVVALRMIRSAGRRGVASVRSVTISSDVS